ncbi:MAG: thymidylate synthase [bacterium]|nr:thymidylate synthase [bacterium]
MGERNMNKHQEYQYLDLVKEVLKDGIRKVDRGTDVVLYSLFGKQTRYDLSKGFPLLTTKRVYWKGVLHELYWFFSGQTNIKYLVDNNVHIWDDYPYKIFKIKNKKSKISKDEFIAKVAIDKKFAEEWGNLPRIYGEMWRSWPTRTKRTIDQLKFVMQEMKEDPDAKNLIVTSWNPEYLYTMAENKDASRFPICHNMYQISNRNGKLSLQLYQRSADLFLGVPFNIASYALLTIVLAKIAGLEPGEFIHTFGDVHIYENHIEQVKEQLKREPRPFPTIKIAGKMKKFEDFTPDKIILENYNPWPPIKGELTVAGGLYEGKKKK